MDCGTVRISSPYHVNLRKHVRICLLYLCESKKKVYPIILIVLTARCTGLPYDLMALSLMCICLGLFADMY